METEWGGRLWSEPGGKGRTIEGQRVSILPGQYQVLRKVNTKKINYLNITMLRVYTCCAGFERGGETRKKIK